MRILGFGREFAGFVPDPITDFIYNPAYLKTFGENSKSFNRLQIYSFMRFFNSMMLLQPQSDLEFFEKDELLSLFVLYPKIGLAYRIGAWQRLDERSYYKLEPWLYGQEGFLYSLNIGKWLKLGVEYNFSWNNAPDWYNIIKYDSVGNPREASIMHLEWSNEGGMGIILTDNKNWRFALAGKKNWETNSFTADTTFWFYWPKDEPVVWNNNYTEFHLNSNFRLDIKRISIGMVLKYYRLYNELGDYFDSRYSYRPGLGIIFYLDNSLLLISAVSYALNKRDDFTTSRKLIFPVGFEKEFSTILNFRFGDTFVYEYRYDTAIFIIRNIINTGLDIKPHQKLYLHFATSNLFSDDIWHFGLSFVL
ncbi:MAG: hypothetical protein ACPL28_12230 [bacterium]